MQNRLTPSRIVYLILKVKGWQNTVLPFRLSRSHKKRTLLENETNYKVKT
jgi:hypothetical protein